MTNHDEQDGDPGFRDDEPAAGNSRFRGGDDWEDLPATPDLERDLGYECREWERFPVADGSEQVMFLPGAEDLLRDDAFVVAAADSLVDLESWC